jgi:cyclase
MGDPIEAALASSSMSRVADRVWVGIPAPGEGAMGIVVGRDGAVVVDTTSYDRFAGRFLAHVAEQEAAPAWRYLLVTHRHWDHFGGASAIPAPMVAHRLTRAALLGYDAGWVTRNLASWTDQKLIIPDLIDNPLVVLPEVTYDEGITVQLGDREVVAFHTAGHTSDSSMVSVPDARVLFGGDNVFHGRPAFTGHGDLVAWIAALERVKRIGIDVVVPGHGAMGGPELLDQQLVELEGLLARDLQGEA